jgi:uncharacterized protein
MQASKQQRRQSRRRQWAGRIFTLILLLAFALPVYGFQIEPYWLQVKSVPLTLPHLASEFEGYRIVQLSDLHIVNEVPQRYLDRVIRVTNRQQPDLVVITGDIVTEEPQRYAPRIAAALKALDAPAVAVLGNHDHWSDAAAVRQILQDSQVTDISNGVYSVQRERVQLHVAGVDDVWVGAADLDQVLAQLPQQGAAILLAHEPDFADVAVKTHRFDLELSGHAHGGQVAIPFWGAPLLPPYGKRYPIGQHQIEDLIQYTNRGIGMVKPRARFNSRPEITVFRLSSP